jgi:NADP-dependent 3-hydroxy acid dehydrogenase YdfG
MRPGSATRDEPPAVHESFATDGPTDTEQVFISSRMRALSEGLRQEVKPYNIRTTVIRRARLPPNCRTA